MSKRKSKNKTKWVLRCPICSSDRNVLWLGGTGGLPVRKCLDCGYIGAAFIEVEAREEPSGKDWKFTAVMLPSGIRKAASRIKGKIRTFWTAMVLGVVDALTG